MITQLGMFDRRDLESEFHKLMRMIPANEADYATHNVHPYPAKFLPHFPRLFVRYYSKENELVLDPMCGSGTTLIESCLAGRRAYGIDIDPIATLIARVSLTPIPEQVLRDYEEKVFGKIHSHLYSGKTRQVELPTEEDFPNATMWFRPEVLKELLIVRDIILSTEASSELKDYGLLCLSLIVKEVSNADPRDIFPERDKDNPIRERKDVVAELRRAFHDNRTRVVEFTQLVQGEKRGEVHQGDARNIALPENSVALVFTSPPYAYAMDYARVHQLSTLLFIMNNDEFRRHRRKYIGTDRVSIADTLFSFEGIEFAQQELRSVFEHDRKLGVILYQYFSDMRQVTKECMRVLKPGGHLVYVIGNSTIRGTHFRTDEVFAKICESLGFRIEKRLERPYYAYRMSRKRNVQSNTIKSDIFIVAQKP